MEDQLSAEATAKNLLRRILPERQWDQLSETGMLEIPGSRGIYRISIRDLTRVLETETRRPRASACLQLTVPAPVNDRIIAEYLLIRNDENLYWQTATITPEPAPSRRPLVLLLAAFDTIMLLILLAQLR